MSRSKPQKRLDVIVVGGGPAGSTIANRLAELGFEVCLVDSADPRKKPIAATLPSAILPLLDVLGVSERFLNSKFLIHRKTLISWGTVEPKTHRLNPVGFNVERRDFDNLLVDGCRSRGVSIFRPAIVDKISRAGTNWNVRITSVDAVTELNCCFLVDATGGSSIFNGRRQRQSAPLLSMSAVWKSRSAEIPKCHIESGKEAWFWHSPISRHRSIVTAFVDPKRLAGKKPASIDQAYDELVHEFRLLPNELSRTSDSVRCQDASCRKAVSQSGEGFIKVGDSGICIDPISSQGILTAIASSLQASIVINTIMNFPSDASLAQEFYDQRQSLRLSQFVNKTASIYGQVPNSPDNTFWSSRATADRKLKELPKTRRSNMPLSPHLRLRLCENSVIVQVSAVVGERVTKCEAIEHPAVDEPVAYVAENKIATLIKATSFGQTRSEIIQKWCSMGIALTVAHRIFEWLWEKRILKPIE